MYIQFPNIDPVAIRLGPLAIHWYALAYLGGILLGWAYAEILKKRHYPHWPKDLIGDAIAWATIGIIAGGRLGYVLFYKPLFYLEHPLQIFMVWHGGMSFHGGFLGVLIALWIFGRKHGVNPWCLLDIGACITPIGLFLGRIANFINGELYGRATDVPWAIIFPNSDGQPRHPSQIYEALSEGLLLFIMMFFMQRSTNMMRKPGMASGVFLILYGCYRFIMEYFREPDDFLGLLNLGLSMGQWLSAPMLVCGIILCLYASIPKNQSVR